MTTDLLLIGLWLTAASLIVASLYGWDKWQATRGGWRISERALHLGELLGGWPGALLAGWLFRHKTQQRAFRLVRLGCITLNVLGVAGVMLLGSRPPFGG
jgi:uncharacterized membrane protein YsdA (DUF1294 family)